MSLFYGAEDAKSPRPLLGFILLTLLAGASASIFSKPALESWYPGLNLPGFAPAATLFAPVWTALYVVMAVAAWRVWRITGTRSIEMALYAAQLGLILLWNGIFFGRHNFSWAFAASAALSGISLVTLILFARRDRIAALLFSLVFAACAFTAIVNYALRLANR